MTHRRGLKLMYKVFKQVGSKYKKTASGGKGGFEEGRKERSDGEKLRESGVKKNKDRETRSKPS